MIALVSDPTNLGPQPPEPGAVPGAAKAPEALRDTVVADVCSAPDLRLGETVVPGETVHAAFMAALDGSFATVARSDAVV